MVMLLCPENKSHKERCPMHSILDSIVENLKQELLDLFEKSPTIEDVEEFSRTKLGQVVVKLTEAYAEKVDATLYEDRAGRREWGMSVERRGDRRTVLTEIGEISYVRTYYALKDGTYDHPIDRVLGIDPYQRVSNRTMLKLTEEAKEGSYEKASQIVTDGKVSRQTVMNAVRRCRASDRPEVLQRKVPVLHIDADEDHVSLQNGKTKVVPLVTVYEGLEKVGEGKRPRHRCVNAFHCSALTPGEDFWEEVTDQIISRYDLTDTRIYLHGDGATWIKQGLEYLPNSTFVLDPYHKNKAKKMLFAGCRAGEATHEKKVVQNALRHGNREALLKAGKRLMELHPERQARISEGLGYLNQNLDAITVRYRDKEAKNGGATEPHVSHVLSRRLSSRPMGWSIKTLEHLVPILATGKIELIPRPQRDNIPEPVVQAAEKAVVLTSKRTKKRFAVDPDRCVTLEVIKGGKTTPLYSALKGLGR